MKKPAKKAAAKKPVAKKPAAKKKPAARKAAGKGPLMLIDEAFDGPPMYFCSDHVPEGVHTTAKIDPKQNLLPPVCEICGRVFTGLAQAEGTFLDLEGIVAELVGEEPVEFEDGTYAQVAYIGEFEDTFPSGEVYPPGAGNVTPGEQKLDQLLGERMAKELAGIGAYFVADEEGTLWALRDVAKEKAGGKRKKR